MFQTTNQLFLLLKSQESENPPHLCVWVGSVLAYQRWGYSAGEGEKPEVGDFGGKSLDFGGQRIGDSWLVTGVITPYNYPNEIIHLLTS